MSVWALRIQEVAKSAELTLTLSQAIDSGQSKVISLGLDMDGNLDRTKVSDPEIEDHYEDVAMAYRHHLINWDMANDAFSYDLEKALRDTKIRRFLSDAIGSEADLYNGVLELARDFGISFPPIVPTKPVPSQNLIRAHGNTGARRDGRFRSCLFRGVSALPGTGVMNCGATAVDFV